MRSRFTRGVAGAMAIGTAATASAQTAQGWAECDVYFGSPGIFCNLASYGSIQTDVGDANGAATIDLNPVTDELVLHASGEALPGEAYNHDISQIWATFTVSSTETEVEQVSFGWELWSSSTAWGSNGDWICSDKSSAYMVDSLGQINDQVATSAYSDDGEPDSQQDYHQSGPFYLTLQPGQTDTMSLFASDPISVSAPGAVPEPSGIVGLLGMLGLCAYRRRR